jgi:hypothetical protein
VEATAEDIYRHQFIHGETIINPEGGDKVRYKLDHPPLPGSVSGVVFEDEEPICEFKSDPDGNVVVTSNQVTGGKVERQSIVLFYNRKKKRGRTKMLAHYEYLI